MYPAQRSEPGESTPSFYTRRLLHVLHNRLVRCHADWSTIFADFELAFARAIAALAAVQSAERERILAELR